MRVRLMGMARNPGCGLMSGPPDTAEILCIAHTFIPLFWLLPYRLTDVQSLSIEELPGEYPVLVASRDLMLQRLDLCIQPLSGLLGASVAPLLLQWRNFLEGRESPVVVLDTWELWRAFADKKGLLMQLQDQFEALERLIETSHLSDELRAGLLEPANLLLPGCDSLCLDDISLTGFGWRPH